MEQNSIKKTNVLIVEDDLICGFLAEAALKNHYNTTLVTNGRDALDLIEKEKFDVILMDINLNDETMDGTKTMRTIRYNRKHRYTKILAVTASSDAKEWYLKQGFDGHYMKPLLEREIVAEIDKHLKREAVFVKNTIF